MTLTQPEAPVPFVAVDLMVAKFVPAVDDVENPTRTEVDAGVFLVKPGRVDLTAMEGWSRSTNFIDVETYGSADTLKLRGRREYEDSSMTFLQDSGGQDFRTILVDRTGGYVLIMYAGDTADRLMDVFPVTVAGSANSAATDGPADYTISFSIPEPAGLNVTIPATV